MDSICHPLQHREWCPGCLVVTIGVTYSCFQCRLTSMYGRLINDTHRTLPSMHWIVRQVQQMHRQSNCRYGMCSAVKITGDTHRHQQHTIAIFLLCHQHPVSMTSTLVSFVRTPIHNNSGTGDVGRVMLHSSVSEMDRIMSCTMYHVHRHVPSIH